MKAEARARFWFPGIDATLEKLVGECPICIQLRPSPPRSPLAPWPHPPAAFHRIHLDFLGPISNKMFLVIVDAYSKWVECYIMNNNITTKAVIVKLCDFMSRFGIPNVIVSDNGTSFTSQEFNNFCILNNISHLFSPVYHPMSNGQAESFVKIIKKGIKTIILSGCKADEFQMRLSKFLFDYRNSSNSTTETSPAKLVFGHKMRSRLDLFTPIDVPLSTELSKLVDRKQCSQVKNYGGKQHVDYKEGDTVFVKKYINKTKFNWIRGIVKQRIGKVLFKIQFLDDHKEIIRHKNQMFTSKGKHNKLIDSRDKSPAHSWHVTLPQEEVLDSAQAHNGRSCTIAETAASSPGHRHVDTSISADQSDANSDNNLEGSRIPLSDSNHDVMDDAECSLPCSPAQAGTSTPRSTNGSPKFSTPQSIEVCSNLPDRTRRNRPIVDYKKYF